MHYRSTKLFYSNSVFGILWKSYRKISNSRGRSKEKRPTTQNIVIRIAATPYFDVLGAMPFKLHIMNSLLMFQYSICMIVLMVLKITLATLIFVRKDALINDIPRILNEAFTKNQTSFHDIERAVRNYYYNLEI